MSTFVGGSLKLKGGQALPVKGGGIKKKKKKKTGTELVVVDDEDGGQQQQQQGQEGEGAGKEEGLPEGVKKVTPEGVVLDPAAVADRRTEAEKKHEQHMLKYEEARAKKAAAKSHRDRIKEFNEKLANRTEHNDLFNVSYTA